jgi:signal transduction histidine kinase
VIGILVIGYISHEDLRTAEEKLRIMGLAYKLNNIILEVRRYEKNYLLYNTPQALQENAKYIDLALKTGKDISNRVEKLKIAPMLEQLNNHLHTYRRSFRQFTAAGPTSPDLHKDIIEEIRLQGQQMVELSENLVKFEHAQIYSILKELKQQLVIWAAIAILLSILIPFLIFSRIFDPLTVIKKATKDIAQGRFKKLEVTATRDEMQQVMEAFNTMVQELEHRQDQLVQSKKLSSIGTLTAGVAHQLNNPLNNISTSCQIAIDDLDSRDPELLRRMLNNIEQETHRARDIVKGLLEFSRLQEFSLRPSPLINIVNRAIELVKSQIPADIVISVDVPEDLVLPVDIQRMQEVFLNLIINASQSIEHQGTITITASTDEHENSALIEIRDTGQGIPKEIRGQLFDPFYTTKEEGKGTGLGLSIVYGIIQRHHGEISVESTPGEGASFHIKLPLG